MRAMTAIGLWLMCLVVFWFGLKAQEAKVIQNYLTLESEEIIR